MTEELSPLKQSPSKQSQYSGLGFKIYFALLVAAVLVLALLAVLWIQSAPFLLQYPFEIDYAEGPLLFQVATLMDGGTIYSPLSEAPFLVSNYPPVFHYLTYITALFSSDILFSGRLVSFVSTLLISLLVGLIAFGVMRKDEDVLMAKAGAVVAALVFLVHAYVQRWGVFMRVDMLAILWEMIGVALFIWMPKPVHKILLSVPFFILAVYTKQSIIAGAGACFVVTFFTDRQLALRFFAVMSVMAIAVFTTANYMTDGEFWVHHVVANRNEYSVERLFKLYLSLFLSYGYVAFIIASLLICISIVNGFQQRQKNSGADVSSLAGDLVCDNGKAILAAFWVLAFIITLAVGKAGSYVNYFIEFVAINSVIFGLAVRHGASDLAKPAYRVFLSVIFLFVSLMGLMTAMNYGAEKNQTRLMLEEKELNEVIEVMKGTEGLVLSENATALYRAGKPFYLQPFIMTQLSGQKVWDQTPLLAQLTEKKIALVVLIHEIGSADALHDKRFTPQMMDAIQQHYRLKSTVGIYQIYEPKA